MTEMHIMLLRIQRMGITVQFCWVPAHMGVKGNEKADTLTKKEVNNSKGIKVAYGRGEAKSLIRTAINNYWQKEYDSDNKERHYYKIQKSVHTKQVSDIVTGERRSP